MKKSQVLTALNSLNWNYGRGDIIAVNVKQRKFTRKPFQCRPEVRSFKIIGNSVHALGHQRKVTPAEAV